MPINLTATTYNQNFDTLANTGSTGSDLPPGWEFLETGTGAEATYGIDDGTNTTGNTYSYGEISSSDRAFGTLRSGNVVPRLGVSFTNNTGTTIKALTINYRGEQWQLGAINRTDRLNFQYSLDATSLSIGTWTNFNPLDFKAPVKLGTVGALDGNVSPNNTNRSGTISGLNIAEGETFYLRWQDFNASGADDGLAIDDFSLTPTLNLAPTNISLSPSSINENVALNTVVGNFTSTDPDVGDTFTYTLVTDLAYPDNGAFTISLTGELETNATLDFETKPTYNILVRTTDAGGLTYDKPLTVSINDIDEFVYLTPNNDIFYGTAGADQINGLAGSDILYGKAGNDIIDGGDGNDIVYGGNDNDLINGDAGSDRLYGDAGNDTIYGDAGNDILYGGGGNDILNGGAGNDILYGNAGIDTFVLAAEMGQDSIYQFENGIDKIQLNGLTFDALLITQSGANTLIKLATTKVTLASLQNIDSSWIDGNDFIIGGAPI